MSAAKRNGKDLKVAHILLPPCLCGAQDCQKMPHNDSCGKYGRKLNGTQVMCTAQEIKHLPTEGIQAVSPFVGTRPVFYHILNMCIYCSFRQLCALKSRNRKMLETFWCRL